MNGEKPYEEVTNIFAGFRLDLTLLFAYMTYMYMTLHDLLIQLVFTFLPI